MNRFSAINGSIFLHSTSDCSFSTQAFCCLTSSVHCVIKKNKKKPAITIRVGSILEAKIKTVRGER